MKLTIWLIAIALIGSMFCLPWQSASADEQGWGMMIKSPHVGTLYLYLTSEGFVFVVKETGAKFVTHSPDWRLVMYNDKTHVYYIEKLSDLQNMTKPAANNKTAQMVRRTQMQNARAGQTATIAGLKATQYIVNTYSPEGGARQAEIWITRSIMPPAQLHKTLEKVFSIDMSSEKFPQGMPLRIKIADEGGKQDMIYDTLSCQRETIKTTSFGYPTDYKRVDSELTVLMDENSRKKMESILDDTDDISSLLGSDAKTTVKPKVYVPNQSPPYRAGIAPVHSSLPAAANRTLLRPVARVGTTSGTAPKKSADDWWGGMINTLGGK